jgi:uncharacterized membrane-anchored protein
MTSTWTRALIVVGTVLVLGGLNRSIYEKERVIRSGTTVYVELAPVDPRSLMQGDYMALRFRLAGEIESWRSVDTGLRRAPITLDDRGVATLARGGSDLHIAFNVRAGGVWLGTNAYFFEEGTAGRYADARFGEFRVDPESGEAVLVGLRDAELGPL